MTQHSVTDTADESHSFDNDGFKPVTSEKDSPQSGLRDFLSIVGVLVSALIMAYVLINYVFQSYQVDGPSMQSTLENNDHLIIWKVPKTVAKVTGNGYIPHRGDIIVFNGFANGHPEQMIKRVIGLPGERVVVSDGSVMVFNKENPQGFMPDETMPYGAVIKDTPGNKDVTVPDGSIFVMGDHRDNSLDSRDYGPVKSEQIIGKLVARVLPLNTFKIF